MSHRRVRRWHSGLIGAVLVAAVGLLYAEPLLLLAMVIPLVYVAFGAVSTVPGEAAFAVERTFDDPTPAPGDRATVTLTIENTSEATLADLRVVDGVPDPLAVVDGSPRGAFALRPGERATVSYTVVAKRGTYDFEAPVVRARGLSATRVRTHVVDVTGDETLSCAHPIRNAPDRNTTLLRAGTHPTDTGGSGLEFHSTREYQPGDPISRIHWRQYAKTDDLTTISFREERAVRTVLVVDARPIGRVTPRPGNPTGTELCGYAAERLYQALRGADVMTSATAVGLEPADLAVPLPPDVLPWAEPDSDPDAGTITPGVLFAGVRQAGADDDSRATTLADSDGRRGTGSTGASASPVTDGSGDLAATSPDGGASLRTDGSRPLDELLGRLPPTAQVVLVSPLLDDWPVQVARTLEERGYPLVVLSPDVTGEASLGQRLRGVERQVRLRAIERAGGTTIGWQLADPIDVALSDSLTQLLST